LGLPSAPFGTLGELKTGHCAMSNGETAATATIKKTALKTILILSPRDGAR
jgi:hypothetical protein